MFGQIMNSMQLASPEADEIFKNCTGDAFRNDHTFLAVLRTIVAPRMKEDDSLHLTVVDVPNSECKDASDGKTLWDTIFGKAPDILQQDQITVVNIGCMYDKSEEIISKLDEDVSRLDGFSLDELRVAYLKQKCKTDARVYLNPDKRTTLMVVANMTTGIWHILAGSVCKTLPWFFVERPGKDDPVVNAVLNAIVVNDKPDEFKRLMALESQKYDFRSAGIRKNLSGFESKYDERVLQNTKQSISNLRDSIKHLYERISEESRNLHDKQVLLMGLQDSVANGGSNELMQYFLMNKHLELESVEDTSIVFSAGGYYIDMWDEDVARMSIDKKSNSIYAYFKSGDKEKAEAFFKACFIDEKLRIKVCAAYQIDAYGGCSALSHHKYPEWMMDCMPNPHTDYFACLGGHESVINQATNCGNYVSAVEQCCASARNLNFSDSVVMERWSKQFFDMDIRCVELPDGTCVTPMEAVEWADKNKD